MTPKDDVIEATEFTAKVHTDHITDILSSFYNIDPKTWITNQTVDSASCKCEYCSCQITGDPPHINCEMREPSP